MIFNIIAAIVIIFYIVFIFFIIRAFYSIEKEKREKKEITMNCWYCRNELIWGGDHTFEDYGIDGEGIVSNLSCPKCEADVEIYKKFDDVEEEKKKEKKNDTNKSNL
tara:strand:- start:1258 stop:1578 length:321 start_codon:yes stop_codon:yes gene_type:complete